MFDPNIPATNAELTSPMFRDQFNGLKDLIDALQTINAAVVDGVSTGNPGDPASVSLSVSAGVLHFSFSLPRGQDGQAGQDGSNGTNGSDGGQGPPGAPFTNFVVDGVTTLNPGEPATASASFDGSSVRLLFAIPRGSDGTNGSNGSDGGQGPPFTNFIVDGVNMLNPTDPASVQSNFDGNAVRMIFNLPRGFTGNDGAAGTPGSNGSDGGQGPPFTNFIVDGVNMLNPTDPASVQSNFDGNAVRMVFNLPRGFTGNDGAAGTPGSNGNDGGQGPPFTNFIVDGVNMLNPTDPASVQTNFDGNAVRMVFNLPRGFTGNDGGTGVQGPPGEVTNAQLNSAINTTSNNTNGVATLDTPFANDPPTLADLELMRAKMNELINALRR